MPLSKKRNRERMKESRLHTLLSMPQGMKPVQPKPRIVTHFGLPEVDADGNIIPECE